MLFFVSCMASDKPQSKPDRCLPHSLTGTFFRHAVKSIGEQKTHLVNGDVGSLTEDRAAATMPAVVWLLLLAVTARFAMVLAGSDA